MANRYWVGGTASWDATAGTKWAATSGGAGGASVPTSADDVYFDANSGAVTVTVSAVAFCNNLTTTGFAGTIGGSQSIRVYGSLLLDAANTWTHTATVQLSAASGSYSVTTAGKSLGALSVGAFTSTATWTLQDALTTSGQLTVTYGTFNTNDYNVTASSLSSSNSNTRTINLGSSTVTLSGTTPISFATSTNLTFNSGTSSVVFTSTGTQSIANGPSSLAFYNVTCNGTSAGQTSFTGSGSLTFNNLTIAAIGSAGVRVVQLSADQTINGTLTLSAGTNATCRTFVRSDTIGTTRTLTCAAVSATDIDFRDITIAGAAAPVSGTRLGDCKGNSGITFDAAKTVYRRQAGSSNWSVSTGWSATSGGTADVTQFPLAQDTVIFPSSPTPYPTSGNTVTLDAAYNIGTIDMSARTSNTMTLATGTQTPTIYGNWINGTGTTLTGTASLIFAGRGSQTITSAGKTFTQRLQVNTPSGSVALQDAFTTSLGSSSAIDLIAGTLDANGYNVTTSSASGGIAVAGSVARTLAIGSGTWTLAGTGGWNVSGANITVTGTGTISMTSASTKTFAGGGIQTYPTLNQGGTGTLTVTGSNKFAGLTNTAIGRIQFTGGTTNEFSSFTISGVLGNLLQLGSTNTTQAILKKPSTWNMGLLSMDMGNNTGLNFLSNDGTMEYLSVSYINGQVTAAPASDIYFGSTNVTTIYYGSSPVTAIYYGSTKVF